MALAITAPTGAPSSEAAPGERVLLARKSSARSSKSKFRASRRPSPSASLPAKPSVTRKSPKKKIASSTWDPSLSDVARLLVGVLALGLFIRWRRQTKEFSSAPAGWQGQPGAARYAGGAVHMSKTPGVDPSTMLQEHTMIPLGISESLKKQRAAKLEEDDDPKAIAAEIDLLTARPLEPNFKMQGTQPASIRPPSRPPLALPGELSAHFTGWAGETLEWHAQLGLEGQDGIVAITDRRLLAIYRRKTFKFSPFGYEVELRRHQHPVDAILDVRSVRGHRPYFLMIAAATVWLFPIGTILACAAIGTYLGYTTPELEITTSAARRRYPLAPAEQEGARRAMAKLRDHPPPTEFEKATG